MPSGGQPCRVCKRPLRSTHSQMLGVGPTCAKKVRREFNSMVEQVRRGAATPLPQYEGAINGSQSLQALRRYSYVMTSQEVQDMVEQDVRRAYLQNLRRNRRPSARPVTIEVESRTRRRAGEEVTVEWIDSERANVHSASGNTYTSSAGGCTCPDYRFRHARNGGQCRHMEAIDVAREHIRQQRREAFRRGRNAATQEEINNIPVEELPTSTTVISRSTTPPIEQREDVAEQVAERLFPTFAQADWTVEEQREAVLDGWRERRAFDGVFISQNDEAWQQLQEEAEREWDYKYENVLGGTGNTFGVELEVKFRSEADRQRALQEVYDLGLTHTNRQQGYHSSAPAGMWRAERDGSLGNLGVEFVSPVLKDDPETWQNLEKITEIIRRNGGYTDNNCGGHVHVGIGPLDHRSYAWQRLARIGKAFEHQFFKMGGADANAYRLGRRKGKHRASQYSAPLPADLSFSGEIEPRTARQRISADAGRRTIFNTTNIDGYGGRPAIEMRYPNGTVDHRQLQAQVQVANAVMHQSAVITNETPLSNSTPRFSESNKHLRRTFGVDEQRETENFRRFLDVLANPTDRKAAAWLWKRGSV